MLTDRVRIDLAGEPNALVDVTPAAVAELGLAPGDQVYLSAKATEIEVYLQPDLQTDPRCWTCWRPARRDTAHAIVEP